MGALNIKDPVVAEKARELAKATGKSITTAVSDALDASLAIVKRREALSNEERERRVDDIVRRFNAKRDPNAPSLQEVIGRYVR